MANVKRKQKISVPNIIRECNNTSYAYKIGFLDGRLYELNRVLKESENEA